MAKEGDGEFRDFENNEPINFLSFRLGSDPPAVHHRAAHPLQPQRPGRLPPTWSLGQRRRWGLRTSIELQSWAPTRRRSTRSAMATQRRGQGVLEPRRSSPGAKMTPPRAGPTAAEIPGCPAALIGDRLRRRWAHRTATSSCSASTRPRRHRPRWGARPDRVPGRHPDRGVRHVHRPGRRWAAQPVRAD